MDVDTSGYYVEVQFATPEQFPVTQPNITLEETALHSFDLAIPNPGDPKRFRFQDVDVYEGSEKLFSGEIERVNETADELNLRLAGRRGLTLKRGGASYSISSPTQVHEAIRDYYATHLSGISTSVTAPAVNLVADDKELAHYQTQTEFENAISPAATDPLSFDTVSGFELAQSCFFMEGEDSETIHTIVSDSAYSGGEGIELTDVDPNKAGETAEWTFTPQYDIPADNVNVAIRLDGLSSDGSVQFRVELNNDTLESVDFDFAGPGSPSWFKGLADGDRLNSISGDPADFDTYEGGTLQAGTTYTLQIDKIDDGPTLYVDCVAVYDDRFNYTFDNSVDANGLLSGPQLKPDQYQVSFETFDRPFNVEEATADATMNDVSGNQLWGFNLNSVSRTQSNTEDFTADFASANIYGTQLFATVQLGRTDATRTTQSPTTGFESQNVTDLRITYDGSDRAIVESFTTKRSHFENLRKLHRIGSLRWELNAAGSLSLETYERGGKTGTVDWVALDRSREWNVEGYANKVSLFYQDASENTQSVSVDDADAIASVGEVALRVFAPDVSVEADAKARARSILSDRLDQDRTRGTIEIAPTLVAPGPSYHIPEWGETVALNSVTFTDSAEGEPRATLDFRVPRDTTQEQLDARQDIDENRDELV